MTEFETRMLVLREREVRALEMQADAARTEQKRNGPENMWIKGPGQLGIGGYWKYGAPDHPPR